MFSQALTVLSLKRRQTARISTACVCTGLLAVAAHAAAPMVPTGKTVEIADGVYVIPDGGVPLVPNVGIVVGEDSVLVVDTTA